MDNIKTRAIRGTGFIHDGRYGVFRQCRYCHGEIVINSIQSPKFAFYHFDCFFETKRGKALLKATLAATGQKEG